MLRSFGFDDFPELKFEDVARVAREMKTKPCRFVVQNFFVFFFFFVRILARR